jgi:hypothetical protein
MKTTTKSLQPTTLSNNQQPTKQNLTKSQISIQQTTNNKQQTTIKTTTRKQTTTKKQQQNTKTSSKQGLTFKK